MAAPAIDEVLFPEEISEHASGGPGFMNTIIKVKSGAEQRIIHWEQPLGNWTISTEGRTPAQADRLVAFFMCRRASGYGFRFQEPTDHAVPDPTPMAQIDPTHYQIVKRYTDDGGFEFVRPIYKPVNGTVGIFDGDTPAPFGWTVDLTTGIVTFDTAPAYAPAAICEFHLPVRLAGDRMQQQWQNIFAIGWNEIQLEELRR